MYINCFSFNIGNLCRVFLKIEDYFVVLRVIFSLSKILRKLRVRLYCLCMDSNGRSNLYKFVFGDLFGCCKCMIMR